MAEKIALVLDEGSEDAPQDLAGGGRSALVLGTGAPPIVNTGGKWKTNARLAYLKERDSQRAHHRELTLALGNTIRDVLGVDVETRRLSGPSVILDGLKISVREYILPAPGVEREYRLSVAVECPFCERENEREFATQEELGEVLCRPSGNCSHCNKPLAARRGSAS